MLKCKSRNTYKKSVDYPIVEIPLKLDISCIFDQVEPAAVQKFATLKGSLGKAIVRLDTGECIATVSNEYKLIKHIDMFDNVEQALKMSGLNFILYDINQGGKNKNRVYVNYILPDYKFEVHGDEYVPYIQAYSCYDRFLSYGLLTGFYRIENESAILIFNKIAARRHLRGKLELREDMIDIGKWIAELGEWRKKIKSLLETSGSMYSLAVEGENIIKKVIKVRKHRQCFKQLGILTKYIEKYGSNHYALFVALMEYATHGLWDSKKRRAYDRSRNAQIQITNMFLK